MKRVEEAVKLGSAVAALRAQDVAGEAFGVHPNRDSFRSSHLALD
eukprot:CAMPEP_0181493298 /NCGR_PEP_ID=MMETSP1110-20121109/51148_1 /TAXON_ID=174948 /ORGANISM="Symbiodinium sp., Strain CCMP421" /LENGTH=44 /DNA_ID= /DNA_START= /DNA_END= /DNA_ORIENTATION=